MNYADIKGYDVANGPGIRVSIFVSGCSHHCKGCFNPETWDFNSGSEFTQETIDEIIEMLDKPYIAGLTLLGGEPLECVNQEGLLPLVKQVRERFPDKSIWCYTGYNFRKDIMDIMYENWPVTKELLSYIDVLVDGEFIEEFKNLNLRFKGSSNQNTILLQESLAKNKVVLWQAPEYDHKTMKGN